jgi:hypothetical protein
MHLRKNIFFLTAFLKIQTQLKYINLQGFEKYIFNTISSIYGIFGTFTYFIV